MDIQTIKENKNIQQILRLEEAMKAMPEAQVEFEVRHHFAPGIYMRELLIPQGTVLTGKIHKTEHLNILSQGHLIVQTEEGMKDLHASTVILSQPGIKRVGFAVTDSVWITVHKNEENVKDVQLLEDQLVVDSFDQFIEWKEKEQKCLSSQ